MQLVTKRVQALPPGSRPPGGFGQAVQLLQRVSRRLPDLEAAAAQLTRPVGGASELTSAAPAGGGAEPDAAAAAPGQVGLHRERLTAMLDRFAAGGVAACGPGDRPRRVENQIDSANLTTSAHSPLQPGS